MSLAKDVVCRFQARLNEAIDHHAELLHAVHNHKRQASLESLLAEQFAFTTTVLWEVFLSDVLMAHVAEDPRTFLADLKIRLNESVKGKFGPAAARYVALTPPATIRPHKVSEWLDPKEWNISVPSAAKLAVRANQLLPAPAAKRFTLSAEDSALFDFTIALRNYLAHRSEGSRNTLKAALRELSGANAPLNAKAHTVSVYLKTRVSNGDMRTVLIARRLETLAGVLA